MIQQYEKYTAQDQLVWKTLAERQISHLQQTCCREYLTCWDALSPSLVADQIPDYRDLDAHLMRLTGWSIHVVKGLIPVEEFFLLLARRKFSASTWLRRMDQLDYLEEPDMFHDVFGHVPLLADAGFARFMERFGQLGSAHIGDHEVVTQLQRLYWFTIEFGLIRQNGRKVYGAGICSSYGETGHCLGDGVEVLPFDLDRVIQTPFRTDVIQTQYFELDGFQQLFDAFDAFAERLGRCESVVV